MASNIVPVCTRHGAFVTGFQHIYSCKMHQYYFLVSEKIVRFLFFLTSIFMCDHVQVCVVVCDYVSTVDMGLAKSL